MGTTIIRLERDGAEYFMEWTSITDSPNTYGMNEQDFREYYQDEYGRVGCRDLDEKIERCRARGTSSRFSGNTSADEVIKGNCAGKDGTELTKDQIIDLFCVERIDSKDAPPGFRRDDWDNILTPQEYDQYRASEDAAEEAGTVEAWRNSWLAYIEARNQPQPGVVGANRADSSGDMG